ncbi:hypothetical protein [Streptomyces lydicus]|uniref:hypothetical protein n=1 Tax=Streptomyces lydicus TaxID=47763 RepID=UPI00343118E5
MQLARGSKAVVAELDLATGTGEPKGLDAGVRVLYLTSVKAMPAGCLITQAMTSSCGITRSSTKISPLSGAKAVVADPLGDADGADVRVLDLLQ